MLHAPQPPTLSAALTSLINVLAAIPQDVIVILDDLYLINDPTIHESLQFLLDHSPTGLHLVIASRADPPLRLARLRARGQVTEIRAPDLKLSDEEAARFPTQSIAMKTFMSPEKTFG